MTTETKEQIRTELINELIKKYDEKANTNYIYHDVARSLRHMLPTETPEKIAERKAVEIFDKHCPVKQDTLPTT